MTPVRAEKVRYAFQLSPDGRYPVGGLIDVNGTLYGATNSGGQGYPGRSAGSQERGTVFRVSTRGAEKVIYDFAGGSDGASSAAALIEVNGVLCCPLI
jgi:hypothetical protein